MYYVITSLRYLVYCLQLACGIMLLVRLRNSAAAVVAGISFALLALIWLAQALILDLGVRVESVMRILDYLRWAWLLDIVALSSLLIWLVKLPAISWTIPVIGEPRDTDAPVIGGAVSKRFYLGSMIGVGGGSAVLSGVSVLLVQEREIGAGCGVLAFAFAGTIYCAVIGFIFIHKMWSAIPRSMARTTPGRAVGLCFIPLFNLYWAFQVFHGWTRDFNDYNRRREVGAPAMPEGVALTLCILIIVGVVLNIAARVPRSGAVPLVFLLAPVQLVLMAVFLNKACDGINMSFAAREADGVGSVTTALTSDIQCHQCGRGIDRKRVASGAEPVRKLPDGGLLCANCIELEDA